jgi:hypothetical protein
MPKGHYKPPAAGDAPPRVKRILKKVYNKCREYNPGESEVAKSKCAATSWFAVEQAGYKKDKKTGRWKRKGKAKGQLLYASAWPQIKRALSHLQRAKKMILDEKVDKSLREWTISRTTLNAIEESYNSVNTGDMSLALAKIETARDWIDRWEHLYRKTVSRGEWTIVHGLDHIKKELDAAKTDIMSVRKQKSKRG